MIPLFLAIVLTPLLLLVFFAFLWLAVSAWVNDFPFGTKFSKSGTRLDGKVALVTGANGGIGLETARDFASRGARVIMGCRNLEKAEVARKDIVDSTGNTNVVVYQVDLNDLESVRQFAEKVNSTEAALHILVNNAGLSGRSTTKQRYCMTFGVNHVAPFLLTNLLVDLLKKSAPSRIVNVASILYITKLKGLNFTETNAKRHKYPGLKTYEDSKFANILHARELAKRLKGTGVTTYSLSPGFVDTAIFDKGKEKAAWFRYLYNIVLQRVARNGVEGAQTSIYCAVEESLAGESGQFYDNCRKVTPLIAAARDDDIAAKLWDVSVKMTQDYAQ